MGGLWSCMRFVEVIRLVHINGRVEEMSKPIKASEVMRANPHFIVASPSAANVIPTPRYNTNPSTASADESDDTTFGSSSCDKPDHRHHYHHHHHYCRSLSERSSASHLHRHHHTAVLPPDANLELGQIYFLLPARPSSLFLHRSAKHNYNPHGLTEYDPPSSAPLRHLASSPPAIKQQEQHQQQNLLVGVPANPCRFPSFHDFGAAIDQFASPLDLFPRHNCLADDPVRTDPIPAGKHQYDTSSTPQRWSHHSQKDPRQNGLIGHRDHPVRLGSSWCPSLTSIAEEAATHH